MAVPVGGFVHRVNATGHHEELILIDNEGNPNWWEATIIVPKADYSRPNGISNDGVYYICAGTRNKWVFKNKDHVLRVFDFPAWDSDLKVILNADGTKKEYAEPADVAVDPSTM